MLAVVAAVASGCGSGADKSSEAYQGGYQIGRDAALASPSDTDFDEGCRDMMETAYRGSTSDDGFRDLLAGCRAGAADLNDWVEEASMSIAEDDEFAGAAPGVGTSTNESTVTAQDQRDSAAATAYETTKAVEAAEAAEALRLAELRKQDHECYPLIFKYFNGYPVFLVDIPDAVPKKDRARVTACYKAGYDQWVSEDSWESNW